MSTHNSEGDHRKRISLPHLYPPPPRGRGRIWRGVPPYPPPSFGRGRKLGWKEIFDFFLLFLIKYKLFKRG